MIQALSSFCFFAACGLLAYTYVLYPLLVLLLAKLRPRSLTKTNWEPRVSLIITAHNEQTHIASKIENVLSLDYPAGRLEILVASDRSTDATDSIVNRYRDRGVRLIALPERVGKTAATQRAVKEAAGEVLAFSDATGLYNTMALRHLLAALSDPTVGAVSGRVEYQYSNSLLSKGFRIYQIFEKALRRAESACGTITSVSGSIHAVRTSLFPFIKSHQSHDLLLPLALASQGLRTVYENEAISQEVSRTSARSEFHARVRAAIVAFSYITELHSRGYGLSYPFFPWAVFSHKILRWFSPLWLILLFVSHAVMAFTGGLWLWAFFPHFGLHLISVLSVTLPPSRYNRLLGAAAFLGTVCAAFIAGLVLFVSGKRSASWESPR